MLQGVSVIWDQRVRLQWLLQAATDTTEEDTFELLASAFRTRRDFDCSGRRRSGECFRKTDFGKNLDVKTQTATKRIKKQNSRTNRSSRHLLNVSHHFAFVFSDSLPDGYVKKKSRGLKKKHSIVYQRKKIWLHDEVLSKHRSQFCSILTCIVDQDVQPGFTIQEVFSKAANRLETGQVQLHEHHLTVPALLEDVHAWLVSSQNPQRHWAKQISAPILYTVALPRSPDLPCGCRTLQPRLSPCCGRPGSPGLLSGPEPEPWPCQCRCCFLCRRNTLTISCDDHNHVLNEHGSNDANRAFLEANNKKSTQLMSINLKTNIK